MNGYLSPRFFRRIFPLIIVARMVKGMLPRQYLLEKYQLLPYFGPLITAYKQGNFSEYDRVLERNADYFARLGVFYILEQRMRVIMFRNLFRTVYVVNRSLHTALQTDLNATG